MALFKVSRGNSESLSSVAKVDGHAYFTMDDGKFFIDYLDPDDNVVKRKPINAQDAETLGLHLPEDFALKDSLGELAFKDNISFSYDEENESLTLGTEGTASDGAAAGIIDVELLPTEDINENAFYRVSEGEAYTLVGGIKNSMDGFPITVIMVDILPEVGEPYIDNPNSPSKIIIYFQKSDSMAYVYLTAEMTGSAAMWMDGPTLMGDSWGGVISSDGEATDDTKGYVIYNPTGGNIKLYHYANSEWHEVGGGSEDISLDSIILNLTSGTYPTGDELVEAYNAYQQGKAVYVYMSRKFLDIKTNALCVATATTMTEGMCVLAVDTPKGSTYIAGKAGDSTVMILGDNDVASTPTCYFVVSALTGTVPEEVLTNYDTIDRTILSSSSFLKVYMNYDVSTRLVSQGTAANDPSEAAIYGVALLPCKITNIDPRCLWIKVNGKIIPPHSYEGGYILSPGDIIEPMSSGMPIYIEAIE